ncbi:MAG: phage tail protein [Burkholderiaceae bacterium]|nr:phage tail protein [Burkholderiaceae bacterium]
MTRVIRGAGGGGKGGGQQQGRTPTEASDSLRSKAYARVVDLLSEGEIEGLVDGARSIYLNDTPLQNRDGSYNFQGAVWVERRGTQSQAYVPGFDAVESSTSVGTEVLENTPITRAFTNPNINAIGVTIGIPQLSFQDEETGDVGGESVRLRIDLQTGGGPFLPVLAGRDVLGMQSTAAGVGTGSASMTTGTLKVEARFSREFDGELYEQIDYRIEYRSGTGAWSTFATGSIVASPGNLVSGNVNTARVYGETLPLVLSSAPYEFRVINLGGPATLSLVGTYDVGSTTIRISGKASSRYQRTYVVPVTGSGPWAVRVVRLSEDSTTARRQNKTVWDVATEIVYSKLRYPNSAYIALKCDASQFSSIPTRAYDVKLLRVRVPVNYDPVRRTYSGSWDGTFKIAWTDNPAWAFYDLVTSERYGLGAFVPEAQVDKWALYAIGRYCDELVPDGFGGLEPRFTCNVYLQSRQEAYKVVNDLASVFRGMPFWASAAITVAQDAPADAAYLFTPANVIEGNFEYSGASAKVRHSVALVSWNDPDDLYRQKVEYVEDADAIARFGVVTAEVLAVGCTSRGQAHRVGRWLLLSEQTESETVSFKTGLEGAIAAPGQIIKVADPARAGVRLGGRLVAATTTAATLDAPVTLAGGQTYTFSALRADGTVMESTVTTGAGTVSSLAFSPPLPEAPAAGSLWVLSSAAVEAQLFRVVSVVENERHEFEIVALAHNPSKYAAVEQGLALTPRSISVLSVIPAAPTGLVLSEALVLQAGRVVSRLDASWEAQQGATSYAVAYLRAGGNEAPERVVTSPSIELLDVTPGGYELRVWSINPFGQRSRLPTTASIVVLGKTAPPADVTGYVVTRLGETVSHAWRPVPDIDVQVGGLYEVRQGATWETGIVVGTTTATDLQSLAPRGARYMVKARDSSGNYSRNEAVADLPDISGINVVLQVDDGAGGFNGPKDQTGEIRLYQAPSWDAEATWDTAVSWDGFVDKRGVTIVGPYTWADMTMPWTAYRGRWLFEGAATAPFYVAPWNTMTLPWAAYGNTWQTVDRPTAGTYTSETIDVGYESASLVTLEPSIELLADSARPWSLYTEPWTAYGSGWTWQGPIGVISAGYEVSTSLDGVAWSGWTRLGLGTLRFRYLRVRVSLATADPAYRPWLTQLLVNIDVPDRVVHLEDVAVPPAGATVSWAPAFVGIKTVQVTLQSAASGDRFTVTGKSETSVTLRVFDSAGSPKAGVVDVDAFGHGERY